MAEVSYDHVEAPGAINIDGCRAFNPGDPVPIDTAHRIGLLDKHPGLEVFPAQQGGRPEFSVRGTRMVDQEIPVAELLEPVHRVVKRSI